MKLKILIAITTLFVSFTSFASERNDISSCYDQAKLSDSKPAASGRLLTVMVDQTLLFPDELQRESWGKIARFIKPGDKVNLYSFSAVVNNQYMRLHYSGTLDNHLADTARNDINMTRLRKLDNCLKGQVNIFANTFGRELVKVLREGSTDHPKTEIIFSLREVADNIQREKSNDNVIFMLSDMMEHSGYASFYGKNKTAANQLKNIEEKELFTDMSGARVYVMGAGLVSDDSGQYYPGKNLENLKLFWKTYFDKSNANLEGFGTPSLNIDLN